MFFQWWRRPAEKCQNRPVNLLLLNFVPECIWASRHGRLLNNEFYVRYAVYSEGPFGADGSPAHRKNLLFVRLSPTLGYKSPTLNNINVIISRLLAIQSCYNYISLQWPFKRFNALFAHFARLKTSAVAQKGSAATISDEWVIIITFVIWIKVFEMHFSPEWHFI